MNKFDGGILDPKVNETELVSVADSRNVDDVYPAVSCIYHEQTI